MRTFPSRAEILAAERQLEQSRRDSVESYRRLRFSVRSRVTKFSSLAVAAGLTVLMGFWLVRLIRPNAGRRAIGASTSLAGVALAFFIRAGIPYLTNAVMALAHYLWHTTPPRKELH